MNSTAECAGPAALQGKPVGEAATADCGQSADSQLILLLSALPFLVSTVLLALTLVYRYRYILNMMTIRRFFITNVFYVSTFSCSELMHSVE